ncbi:MAG: hypothetical protein DRN29_07790 [Thermoplasmata archaeon]|nr:MAG: hypothetical protein DRN29_07790 [Thermoplasmata archaeon]
MEKIKKYAWIMDALSQVPFSLKTRAIKKFLTGGKEYLIKGKKADIDAIIKCALCPNMCKFDCPVLEATKNESVSPSGKMRIAYFLEKGLIESSDAIETIYECCNCWACMQHCFFNFSVGELLVGVRQDIVEKAPEKVMELIKKLTENHVMDERGYFERKDGSILYFMGCVVQSKQKEIADAMIKIFEAAKQSYALLAEEWCCGYPLYNLGFIEEFKKFAEHNMHEMKKYEAIVCSCPSCTYMFKEVYPKLGFRIEAKVYHATEYIHDLIENKQIETKKIEEGFVYHDACVLARKLSIIEEPRKILSNVVNLKEPYFNKKETRCCGNGGQLGRIKPDISRKIAKKRMEELQEIAENITTACPSCKTAFEGRAYDIAEVVSIAIK